MRTTSFASSAPVSNLRCIDVVIPKRGRRCSPAYRARAKLARLRHVAAGCAVGQPETYRHFVGVHGHRRTSRRRPSGRTTPAIVVRNTRDPTRALNPRHRRRRHGATTKVLYSTRGVPRYQTAPNASRQRPVRRRWRCAHHATTAGTKTLPSRADVPSCEGMGQVSRRSTQVPVGAHLLERRCHHRRDTLPVAGRCNCRIPISAGECSVAIYAQQMICSTKAHEEDQGPAGINKPTRIVLRIRRSILSRDHR